ncbi:MAG: hypothetical protein ACRCUH_15175 [Shewanella sp.]
MKLIYDLPKGSSYHVVNGKNKLHRFYIAWKNIFERCYSAEFHMKNPSYIGCVMCDDWLYASKFKKWFDANSVDGWQIDKDLLTKDNKMYSPKYCRFVPQSLNALFTGSGKSKGLSPKGVCRHKNGKYIASMRVSGVIKHLGYYHSEDDAKDAYLKAKKEHVLSVLPSYLNLGVCHDLIKSIELRVSEKSSEA